MDESTEPEPRHLDRAASEEMLATDGLGSSSPTRLGQFRVSTLISWTTVFIVLLVSVDASSFFAQVDANLPAAGYNSLFDRIWIGAIFFFPAMSCIPCLIDKFLDKQNGLEFGRFGKAWLTFGVSLFSVFSLMLATHSFPPEWKGGPKGSSWVYLVHDNYAGMTLWPFYLLGAVLFWRGVANSAYAKRTPVVFVSALINAVISFWYVFAVFFGHFSRNEFLFAIVPGSCGVCYSIYAAIIWKHSPSTIQRIRSMPLLISGWIALLGAAVIAKYPLAKRIYDELPDEPPDTCFVVTAASKGHPRLVGTWFDHDQQRTLNRQLLTFWRFEDWMRKTSPNLHRRIRAVYNRVGPLVAQRIKRQWQADLVFLSLKPLEWMAGLISADVHPKNWAAQSEKIETISS